MEKSIYASFHSASLSACLYLWVPKRQGDIHAKLSVHPLTAVELACMHGGSQATRVTLEIHICLSHTETFKSLWGLQWEEQMFWDNDFWLSPS